MLSFDGEYILCDCRNDCPERIKNHSWGKIKSGWFFLKGGKAFHPDHKPDWVDEWHLKKGSSTRPNP